jgi:hypothetical protein
VFVVWLRSKRHVRARPQTITLNFIPPERGASNGAEEAPRVCSPVLGDRKAVAVLVYWNVPSAPNGRAVVSLERTGVLDNDNRHLANQLAIAPMRPAGQTPHDGDSDQMSHPRMPRQHKHARSLGRARHPNNSL